MVRSGLSLLITLVLFVVTGCGSVTRNGAAGGVVGGAVGAGTGALVGSLIANGDVAASALVGGAIGIPVGIALGAYVFSQYDSRVQEERLIASYLANQSSISEQEAEIQRLREGVLLDSPSNPNFNQGVRKPFQGSTLGSH